MPSYKTGKTQCFRHPNRDYNRSKVSILKVLRYGLKVNFKVIPLFFIVVNIISLCHGLSWGVNTFVTQQFYDSVTDVLTQNGSISRAYLMVAALGLSMITKSILNGAHNFCLSNVSYQKVMPELTKLIHDKMARIDPICLEDTKIHDDIEKAGQGADMVFFVLNYGIMVVTCYVPYFIFMGFYLHYLKPQFILAIVFVFVPVFMSQLLRVGIIAKFEDKAAPVRRELEYYNAVITSRGYYKETRIWGGYSFFLKRFLDSLKKLSKAETAANRRTSLLEFGMSLTSALGYAGIIYMLVTALLAGEISVGAFGAVFGSIGMMYNTMDTMINVHIGHITTNLGMAHNFIRFMELPERKGVDKSSMFEKGIVIDNVSFTYPNAERKSVDNVSLEIKAGETVAIVGENGSGKTTLVRLLIGLYIPTSGRVLLGGMDTSETSRKSLFANLSGVFQKFQRYQMTLEENVHISDSKSSDAIDVALEQAGVNIDSSSFPDGVSTMLSREFDGVDLSGGEWQRVAIARGLYRAHNVVVLDEPTAAIDPIEESRIYKKFVEISKDKTTIIVTHRLGSTKIADRVVVMDKGKIIDVGTHSELMQRQGLYAEMYNAQASWYEDTSII